MNSCLYSCNVFHQRTSPRKYGFNIKSFMFLLDLDEIDRVIEEIPLISHNRSNFYSFRDDDHLYLGQPTLRQNVENYLLQHDLPTPPKRIELLTNLRTFGHVFNPVSFFFCYDTEAEPMAVIAEVHNTFGELKPFLLTREDLQRGAFSRSTDKHFYISPFSELDNSLEIKANLPAERLAIYVNSSRPDEPSAFFRSSLTGKRIPLQTSSLLGYSILFPFITLKVVGLIHWHAFRLWRAGVPFRKKSADTHLQTGILPKKHQISTTTSQ